MKRILIYSLATLLPILGGIVFLNFYGNQNSFPIQCIFHSITGLWCPGCGGQRAFSLLLHGHILESLRYNIVLPIVLYFAIIGYYSMIGNLFLKEPFSQKLSFSSRATRNFLIFLVIYSILRNIPFVPFIYLAPVY